MLALEGDEAAEARYQALLKAGTSGAALEGLVAALYDVSWRVRKLGAELLSRVEVTPALVNRLIAVLGDRGQTGARNAAAMALAQFGPAAMPSLIGLLNHADPDQRKFAADILGELRQPDAVGALIERVGDRDANVCVAAAEALGRIGGMEACRALEHLLDSEEPLLRLCALEGLAQLGRPPLEVLEVGQPEEAGRHLEMLRVRRPQDDQVLIRLAFAWHQTGRSGESLEVLDALLARAPDNVLALSAHAQIDFQLGRIAAAESYARRALALDPYDRQAHFTLYQSLAQQPGREEEAKLQQAQVRQLEVHLNRLLEVTNRLIPQRPKDPELHCELGTLLRSLGRKELALGWYESALKLDPNHPGTHRALADYYTETGDPQKAAQHRLHADANIPKTGSGP